MQLIQHFNFIDINTPLPFSIFCQTIQMILDYPNLTDSKIAIGPFIVMINGEKTKIKFVLRDQSGNIYCYYKKQLWRKNEDEEFSRF